MSAETCARCHQQLRPDDDVIKAVQQVDATVYGEDAKQWLEGLPALVHSYHYPPSGGTWKKVYEGPLHQLPP